MADENLEVEILWDFLIALKSPPKAPNSLGTPEAHNLFGTGGIWVENPSNNSQQVAFNDFSHKVSKDTTLIRTRVKLTSKDI